MANGFAPGSKQGLNYLRQLLIQQNVDPRAAMSVFSVEGASGGIGDGGHAFGPGQFNNAGGVWTGRYKGLSPQQINAIAWSSQGLQELAQRVGRVAGGLKGRQAVQRIVTQFERPADPKGEVAKALARLGGGQVDAAWDGPGKPVGGPPPTGLWGGRNPRKMILQNLIGQQNAFLTGQEYTGPSLAQQMQKFNLMQQAQGSTPFFAPPAQANNTPYTGKVKFVGSTKAEQGGFLNALGQAVVAAGGSQVKITSGYRDPARNAAVGGVSRSKHLTGSAMDGYTRIGGKWVPLGTALLPVARKFGLRSGDVAGFYNGGRDPVHVDWLGRPTA